MNFSHFITNRRIETIEQRVSELEVISIKITQFEEQRDRGKYVETNEQSHKDPWNNSKGLTDEVPEGEQRRSQAVTDKNMLKFSESHRFIDLRSSVNPKQDKTKKNHALRHKQKNPIASNY